MILQTQVIEMQAGQSASKIYLWAGSQVSLNIKMKFM